MMKNDGSRPTRYDMIANQMMKGCHGSGKQSNVAGTPAQIEDFKRVYHDTIAYLEKTFPKNITISVGVCGALGKAILWYGKEKMEPFVEAIAKREFKGRTDPCHFLWEWLIRYNKRSPNDVYRKTVAIIRVYLRGGQCGPAVKSALDDIFEWENNYRVMYQLKRNQHTKFSNKSIKKQTDEAILADIEDALNGCQT